MEWFKYEDIKPKNKELCEVKYKHKKTRKAIFKDGCFYDNSEYNSGGKLKQSNIEYWRKITE
jgi:G:T-mismatch repair DNA endonuclease (very short patch repair protein)